MAAYSGDGGPPFMTRLRPWTVRCPCVWGLACRCLVLNVFVLRQSAACAGRRSGPILTPP